MPMGWHCWSPVARRAYPVLSGVGAATSPSHRPGTDCRGGTGSHPTPSQQPQRPFAPEVTRSLMIGWQDQSPRLRTYPEVHLTRKAHPLATQGAAILFQPPFYGGGSHFGKRHRAL